MEEHHKRKDHFKIDFFLGGVGIRKDEIKKSKEEIGK
jgi:hypothetical protein